MKFLIKIFFGFIFLVLLGIGALMLKIYTDVGSFDFDSVKTFYIDKARNLDADDKQAIKDNAQDLKYKIYEEATEHNPEGDLLPDEIDDTIKEKIKEEIREN